MRDHLIALGHHRAPLLIGRCDLLLAQGTLCAKGAELGARPLELTRRRRELRTRYTKLSNDRRLSKRVDCVLRLTRDNSQSHTLPAPRGRPRAASDRVAPTPALSHARRRGPPLLPRPPRAHLHNNSTSQQQRTTKTTRTSRLERTVLVNRARRRLLRRRAYVREFGRRRFRRGLCARRHRFARTTRLRRRAAASLSSRASAEYTRIDGSNGDHGSPRRVCSHTIS